MANFPSRGSAWVLISGGFFLFFSVCDASGGRCGVVILCTGQRSSEDVSVPSLLMYRADPLPLYRIVGLKEPPIPLDIHRHPAFEPRKARAVECSYGLQQPAPLPSVGEYPPRAEADHAQASETEQSASYHRRRQA